MEKNDNILITGASGFIGLNLVKNLEKNGYRNLRLTSNTRDTRETPQYESHKGDLRDAEFCKTVTEGIDVIFHCAANTSNALDTKFNPLIHVTPNLEMNINLLEQAWKNKVSKFVFLSSSTVYPDMGDEKLSEENKINGTELIPAYKAVGGMKRYTEELCEFFSNTINDPMQCIVIRPGNAYGQFDKFDFEKCHVTPASIRKVAEKMDPIPVWGDGKDVRDLIYIEDLVDGILFVAENTNSFDVINVCHGEAYSVNEVLDILKGIANHNTELEHVDNKAFMVSIRRMSNDKIKKMGWHPKHTIKEGLEKAYHWYKNNTHRYNSESKL